MKTIRGYRAHHCPGHPKADVTGHVFEHVLIAEKALGRPIAKGEIVHHKDFDKQNNDPSNLLFPISRGEHQRIPEWQARFIIEQGLYDEFMEYRSRMEREEAPKREREAEIMRLEKQANKIKRKLKKQANKQRLKEDVAACLSTGRSTSKKKNS